MRKKLVVLLLLTSIFANAQVWNGNLDFHSQQEIDDFSNLSYTSVTGYVSINDGFDGEQDITNLAGLAGITSVGGNFSISQCNLLTNTAFINLTSAGGFQITFNENLGAITGIQVTSVTGDIFISNNSSLTGITAFNNLTTIGQILALSNNPLLTDISGFSNLHTAGSINVLYNAVLANLHGFSNLERATSITVHHNPSLINLDGLSNLDTLGSILLFENQSLANVDGLSGLTGRTELTVMNNNALQSINGAAGISNCKLSVLRNGSLKTISGFANAVYADLHISENKALESITGFNNVQRAGTVHLEDNWVLKTINFFPQVSHMSDFFFQRNYVADDFSPMPLLDTVRGDFTIVTDTMLTNLDFVPGLRFVAGSLRILGIERLESINGLSNLDSIGRDLMIGLFYVPDIDALSKIEHVPGNLELGAGYEIENLRGLRNLKTVGRQFLLGGMFKVTNLDGLANLEAVDEFLSINLMFELTNINGLRNLRNVHTIHVTNNARLSGFCGLYGLFTLNPPVAANISGNLVNPTADDIRGGGACAALPVRWVDFALRCAGNKIFLTWLTSNEVDNSHFIVQRSANGSSWSDLRLVPAAGNGGVTKYSFTDDQPLDNTYYRLAQVDIDGKVHYSAVMRANCTATAEFKLWPNPATIKVLISIQSNTRAPGVVRVFDGKGRLVKAKNLSLLPGQNQVEVDISGIPGGVYIVHASWDENRQQKRSLIIKE